MCINKSKIHYVYRITNIISNKHYYGVRSTSKLPLEDLGVKYFSSSSIKSFIKEQNEKPNHFKYKILRIYNTKEEAVNLEIKLHEKFNVPYNDNFYNKARQTNKGFDVSFRIEIRDRNNNLIDIVTKTRLLKWSKENDIPKEKILNVLNNKNNFLYENETEPKYTKSNFYGFKIIKL